jgi:hypothetical protein
MKVRSPIDMTNEQLVVLFKQLSFQQDDVVDSPKKYRKAFEELNQICEELRQRGPDARRGLLPLLDCPSTEGGKRLPLSAVAQCRYNAATELLALEPEQALVVLRKIANGIPGYQRLLAHGTLKALENGSLKPT